MKKTKLSTALFCLVSLASFAQELNKTVLDSIVGQCEKANSNALLIYKGDKLLYENYFGNPKTKIEAMSATKSVVSIAVMMLLEKNYIDSLDQPVHTIYPEWKQGNKKLITIRHLLEHTSGLQNLKNAGIEVETAPDVVQLALCAELDTLPGSVFSYNNKACNLLAGIVEKTSKLKLDEFLGKYLFAELGITDYAWRRDSTGNPYAMAGLLIHPSDLAKIGRWMLNGGKWNGKQLMEKELIEKMRSPSLSNKNYAFQWWLLFENQFYVLDDGFLASIRHKTDENTFHLLGKFKGKYPSFKEMAQRGMQLYSREELMAVAKLLKSIPKNDWKIENSGKTISYAAMGYLGQYLIVIPEKELVVVRMIEADNFKKIPNNNPLDNLPKLANEL